MNLQIASFHLNVSLLFQHSDKTHYSYEYHLVSDEPRSFTKLSNVRIQQDLKAA